LQALRLFGKRKKEVSGQQARLRSNLFGFRVKFDVFGLDASLSIMAQAELPKVLRDQQYRFRGWH